MKLAKAILVYKWEYIKRYKWKSAYFGFIIFFPKIIEKVVCNRTIDFFTKQFMIDKQYGFRQKHSTYMALLVTVN